MLLKGRQIQFVRAYVKQIDPQNKRIKTNNGDLDYSELVIALGSEPNYYGIRGAKEFSLPLHSVSDALRIQAKLNEICSNIKNPNIVIGGGGFTGVELAGEIANQYKCCVTVIEGSGSLLPSWHMPQFSKKVEKLLAHMGAKLILGQRIIEAKQNVIVLEDKTNLESSLFVWTAGVGGSQVVAASGLQTGNGQRATIGKFCEVSDFPDVYVIGDSSLAVDRATGAVLPQCIQIALQQAGVVSRNILADVVGRPRMPYRPKFDGLILAVGKKYGVGKLSGIGLEGKVALVTKKLIHLHYVYGAVGFRRVLKEI